MTDSNLTTTTAGALPWDDTGPHTQPETPHLTLIWSLDEPDRVGETASLGAACVIGRGPIDESLGAPLASFHRPRPGTALVAPPLRSRRISRQQLLCAPSGTGSVKIRNIGRLTLKRNGVAADEAEFEIGDTVEIEGTAAFLLERRPRLLPPLQFYPRELSAFAFGAPDSHGIIGETAEAWRLREQLAAAARADCHVLFLGESGVGKELAVRAAHALSRRSSGPLVSRNAATFPETLLDAELFGTVKHFPNTGSPERPGLVGEAHGGTLFLDEIGDLPQPQQAHLLRVLDADGEYQRLGEARVRHSDFRVYAATNRPASALKGDFLARFGAHIQVPGLPQRPGDIPLIARRLILQTAETIGAQDPGAIQMTPDLACAVVRHQYVAHVRELSRFVRLALQEQTGSWLRLTARLKRELRPPAGSSETITKEQLLGALATTSGNKAEAADLLGLSSRFVLHRLMKKFGVG